MRPVILTFCNFYLPGYRAGGPIRTIANLVDQLGDSFDFRIITLDRDLSDVAPYKGVMVQTWVRCGKAMVYYISPSKISFSKIAELVRSTPHDLIYLNSFLDPRFTQRVLINRRLNRLSGSPIVLAPRGELSGGALRIGYMKKLVYIKATNLARLYDGLTWQASSQHEAAEIRSRMRIGERNTGQIIIAPNLVESTALHGSNQLPHTRELGDPLQVCFLSRISPMKNLEYALRVLAKVRANVCFRIYGPIEDVPYWAECQSQIRLLPSNIEVEYSGPLNPVDVVETLMRSDLFFLPTRGENFGHVIQEALMAGLPILISDQTPWRNLEKQQIGWDLPLDSIDGFVDRIEKISAWRADEQELWSRQARTIAEKVAHDPATINANHELFLNAI